MSDVRQLHPGLPHSLHDAADYVQDRDQKTGRPMGIISDGVVSAPA